MALGALDIIIAADTAQLRKGMDEAVGIMKSSTKTMENAAKTAAGAIAGYFALDSISESIKQTLDFADSLSKMSQKVGVSVDALYSLQAAGKLSDVTFETLEKSLLKFNKGLGAAEIGTGSTANALKNLGISLKDSSGHLKTSDQYLFEVADKFASMPNGIAKSTLAMELFGKSGAEMIPLLNSGSEALKEYSGVINAQTAQAAERFNDSITKIGLSVETSSTTILTGMLPAMESLSGTFEDIAKWVLKNQGAINEFTEQAGNDFTAIGMVGHDAFTLIADTSSDMLKAIASVFDYIPGLMGRSSDDAIDNFGFFEYFILGMSTATNGIGQFVANAKMAYATVAEYHAKYGSVSGLVTNGGYDAAKARMDYHAAQLEAQKYTKNVSETYDTLLGLKKEFKSKNGGSENPLPNFDLEDFDKKEESLKKQLDEAKKIHKGYLDGWAELEAKAAIEKYETEKGYLEAYADLEAKQAIDQYEIEKGYLEAYADLEAKAAIEEYERQTKLWDDLFSNINKAMESQFFDAMTGKFESFGSWLKDFWGAMTNSLARGLSKSLADAMINTGAGGIQNIFKTFGGLGSVFGSSVTPEALIGASTDSAGFTTTEGGTVFDAAGQITKEGSDLSAVTDALNIASTAHTAYSVITGGLSAIGTKVATGFGYVAEGLNMAGLTSAGTAVSEFGLGAGSIFTGGAEFAGMSAMGAGQLLGGAAVGALGGYALGSLGDSLFGADTRAGSYGAIGGGLGGAIGTFLLPGVGTAIGAGLGAALGSVIGGIFGKTKATGSGLMAWGDISADSIDGLQSYTDYRKKSWFKSKSWTEYYGLDEKTKKQISGIFTTYDYLLGQLGGIEDIIVSAGKYSGSSFFNAIDKAFIRAFIDDDYLTDTLYSAWTDYAAQIGKSVQETFASLVSGYIDYTRGYEKWMLEAGGNTLESLKLQAQWAQSDYDAIANLYDISGITVENYLDEYSKAIKSNFTPETITQWQSLGDALMKATDANQKYTDSLKELTASSVKPMDMMLSRIGTSKDDVSIRTLADQNAENNAQTSQMVASLYEVVKVLKQQYNLLQFGANQGVPA